MHLHVSADNLELLLDIHDLLLRNLDNVRMGSLSLFLSLASYGFVSTYGLCSAVLTSRISKDIISSVFLPNMDLGPLVAPGGVRLESGKLPENFPQICSWKRVLSRAHNLCHDNRQLIVIAINRNHSASKINCN